MAWGLFEEQLVRLALQEDDVVAVMPSKDFAAMLPLGDRVLIEVPSPPHKPYTLNPIHQPYGSFTAISCMYH